MCFFCKNSTNIRSYFVPCVAQVFCNLLFLRKSDSDFPWESVLVLIWCCLSCVCVCMCVCVCVYMQHPRTNGLRDSADNNNSSACSTLDSYEIFKKKKELAVHVLPHVTDLLGLSWLVSTLSWYTCTHTWTNKLASWWNLIMVLMWYKQVLVYFNSSLLRKHKITTKKYSVFCLLVVYGKVFG